MANYGLGRYLVELLGQQGFSEAGTGTTQFYMKFQVMAIWSHEDGQWHQVETAERTLYKALTANTAQYFAEDLRALGYTGNSFGPLDMRHPQAHIFQGEIEMTCQIETYNGKTREKWNIVRGSGREERAIDGQAVKKLDALYGKALKETGPVTVAPGVVTPAVAGRVSGLQPKAPTLVSQPRQRVPDAVQDPTTGYAVEGQAPVGLAAGPAGKFEIDDTDLPF